MAKQQKMINNRYRVLRKLGAGGMGEVLLVADHFREEKLLALKKLTALQREESKLNDFLKQEFHTLSRLSHPNLATVYDFGFSEIHACHFFTAEFFDGVDMRKYFKEHRDIDLLIQVIVQICRALEYIHARGYLHLDIKPSNLLVQQTENGPLVKLVDFGTAKQATQIANRPLAGTPKYTAPEMLNNESIDFKADLYALGVTIESLIHEHFGDTASDSKELLLLEEIVIQLTKHLAYQRPHRANAIINMINQRLQRSYKTETEDIRLSYVHTSDLIGRDSQVTQLNDFFYNVFHAKETFTPACCLIYGEQGVGKSRLAKEMRYHLQAAKRHWFQASCRDQELAVTSIINQILTTLGSDHKLTKKYAGQFEALFLRSETADRPDKTHVENKQAALGESILSFLKETAAQLNTVICFEDLQYASHFDLELFKYLVRGITYERGKKPIALVGLLQEGTDHARQTMQFLEEFDSDHLSLVQLKNFHSQNELAAMLQNMFRNAKIESDFTSTLFKITGGNPFFIEEFIKNVIQRAANLDDIRFDSNLLDQLKTPKTLQALFDDKLNQLSSEDKDGLSLLCLTGQPLPIRLLLGCLHMLEDRESWLQKCMHLNILERRWQDEQIVVQFKSEAMREMVYKRTYQKKRKQYHAIIAAEMQRYYTGSLEEHHEELAIHYLGAEMRAPAREYGMQAAETLFQRFAYNQSLNLFIQLLEFERKNQTRKHILSRMAEICSITGHLTEAQMYLESIISIDRKDVEAHLKLAELAKKRGHHEETMMICAKIGQFNVSASDKHMAVNLVAEAQIQKGQYAKATETLQQFDSEKKLPSADSMTTTEASNLARTYHTLGLAYYYQELYQQAEERLRQALDLANRFAILFEKVTSLYRLGMVYAKQGRNQQAIVFYQRAKQDARQIHDLKQLCSIELNLGTLYQDTNDLYKAHDCYRDGLRYAVKMEDRTNKTVAHFNLATLYHFIGDIQKASSHANAALRTSRQFNQRYFLGFSQLLVGVIATLQGELNRARSHCLRAARLLKMIGTRDDYDLCLLELTKLHLKLGNKMQAERYLQSIQNNLHTKKSPRLVATLTLLLCKATEMTNESAILRIKEVIYTLEDDNSLEAQDLLWQLFLRLSELYAKNGESAYSQLNLRLGMDTADKLMRSLPDPYRKSFEASPERQVDLEKLHLEMNEVTRADFSDSDLSELSQLLTSGRNKLAPLVEISRKLNSLLDLECLLNLIVDILMNMSGASHGCLLIEEDDELKTHAERNISGDESRVSHSVARLVMQSGKPLITKDAATDRRTDDLNTVLELGLKSILCLPFRLKGKTIGVVYLEHRGKKDAFDEETIDVLEAVADLAATAIHNARLHTEIVRQENQIRKLNRKLREQLEEKELKLVETEKLLAGQQTHLAAKYRTHNIIARSRGMQEVLSLVDRVSRSYVTVLVQGESGTGKELIARAIHYNSGRKHKPFLTINCAALSDTLLESELFGHMQGSFTGADRNKRGLFEAADGGTLFLDEVGDMSTAMQTKLLRALQEGEIRRVGSDRNIKVDVRIVSATNRNLEKEVKRGAFRQDLFFRLNTVLIEIPPLRKRRQDISLLAAHFIAQSKKAELRITSQAMERLQRYAWPGNVRELENEIHRALIFAEKNIAPEHLSPKFNTLNRPGRLLGEELEPLIREQNLESVMARLEREVIEAALSINNGKKGVTADKLGITRYTLYRKLRQLTPTEAAKSDKPN